MKEKTKGWIGWIVAAVVAAGIVWLVYEYEVSYYGITRGNQVRFIGDGFFVAAVLYLGIGALVWIANLGGLNGLRYLTYQVVTIFTPKKHRFEERKSYYDFLRERDKKGKTDNKVLLTVGGVCLLASIILAVVFDQFFLS